MLLVNIFLLAILGLSWKKLALIPFLALIIGYKFLAITFQFNPKQENESGLQVLTYNSHLFNYKRKNTGELETNVFAWLADHPAQVKVFQEFYQDQTSSSRNALKILSENGQKDYFYHVIDGDLRRRSYGMAIFSDYPIINKGVVFDTRHSNGAIFADIQVNNDTIRIYNVHLQSMAIAAESLDEYKKVKQVYRQTLGKLHQGSLARAEQLSILFEHLNNSPHRVILMGDLNEIPYSFAYFKLSQNLKNAFEVAGRGFGFTYNRVLFFLRIDHIFSSPELMPVYFNTYQEVDYSDHYPVSATFTWKEMKL